MRQLTIGEVLRDESMLRAERNADEGWYAAACGVVLELSEGGKEFTTDEVLERLAAIGARTHELRALGPVMAKLARRGLIELAGKARRSRWSRCHARPKAVWRGVPR